MQGFFYGKRNRFEESPYFRPKLFSMKIVLLDTPDRIHLLPLTFTRPVSEIRVGILTIKEKWEQRTHAEIGYRTQNYLTAKYGNTLSGQVLLVHGGLCPNDAVLKALENLKEGESLQAGETILAQRGDASEGFRQGLKVVHLGEEFTLIDRPWKIFHQNAVQLEEDFEWITRGRESAPLSSTNTVLGDRIFMEEGAEAECAIFNTHSGPVYLGRDSVVMEGSVVRGALALCEHAQLKLSTKIYGATTVGPHSKVGGEVNNSVITGYSNKGHDGFLGNSVLGEWCNIGADSNNSNLKNNYDEVKLWSYARQGFARTGLQFCGLIMGDHSKCGINTMFNTGTVVGVSANIFGAGFPRNFIPSYSWGGASGFTTYNLEKALKTAALVMERRGIELDETERSILAHIFEETASFRQN